MNQLNTNPMDELNQIPALSVVLDAFKACNQRSFRQVSSAPLPEPDTEKDQPLELGLYQTAIATISPDLKTLQNYYEGLKSFITNAKPTDISRKFPPGQKFCFNIIPLYQGGLPTAEVKLCPVSAKGLTFGVSSDPAYYYLNFPLEIQQQCSFKAPFYANPNFVSVEERHDLLKCLEYSWNNIVKLLNLQ